MLNDVVKIKGFQIKRNVNIYLHKPVSKLLREALSPSELVQHLQLYDKIVDHQFVSNDVVDAGEIWIAELLAQRYVSTDGVIGTPLSGALQFIAVGIGVTAVTQNDIKLVDHLFSKASTTTFVGGGADNKFLVSVTFTTGEANGALTEAGIFALIQTGTGGSPTGVPTAEDSINNRIFNRTVFSVINKTSDFQLTIQWTIEVGALTA